MATKYNKNRMFQISNTTIPLQLKFNIVLFPVANNEEPVAHDNSAISFSVSFITYASSNCSYAQSSEHDLVNQMGQVTKTWRYVRQCSGQRSQSLRLP